MHISIQHLLSNDDNRRSPSSPSPLTRTICRVALGLLALLIYVTAAIVEVHDNSQSFGPESTGVFPAAISFAVDGDPIGLIDSNVAQAYYTEVKTSSPREAVDATVKKLVSGEVKPSHTLGPSGDGNGAVPAIFASLAMRLFGPRASSLAYAFLGLMAVSALLFLASFRDDRSFFVALVFAALTLILLSPLTTTKISEQVSIGGIRYGPILGILPAVHIVLEIWAPFNAKRLPAFIGQVLLLVLAILWRGSAGYLAVAIAIMAVFFKPKPGSSANDGNDWWSRITSRLVCATCVAGLGVWLTMSLVPDSVASGRFLGVVWHRVFISFGVNPAWPFGNIHETFTCGPGIPRGVGPGVYDQAGHCVWLGYGQNPNRPPSDVGHELYDANYDKALRSAVFYVLRTYPWQSAKTFFVYKVKIFSQSMLQIIKLTSMAPWVTVAAGLEVLMVIVFALFFGMPAKATFSIGMACLLCSTMPQFVAWSIPHTMADTLAWLFFLGLGVSAWAGPVGIGRLLRLRSQLSAVRA